MPIGDYPIWHEPPGVCFVRHSPKGRRRVQWWALCSHRRRQRLWRSKSGSPGRSFGKNKYLYNGKELNADYEINLYGTGRGGTLRRWEGLRGGPDRGGVSAFVGL